MARHLSKPASDSITLGAGSLTTDGGPTTVVILWRGTGGAGETGTLLELRNGGAMQASFRPHWGTTWYVAYGSDWDFVVGQAYSDSAWRIDSWTKPSGLATIRTHSAPLGGSWTHADLGTQRGDSASAVASVVVGNGSALGYSSGDVAAIMVVQRVLADAEVESLSSGLAAWVTAIGATPAALWAFNQASVATPVTDLTGGGADQTAISGTSVTDDPPGFSYDLAAPHSVSELTDAFTGSFGANWNANYGTVSIVGDRARVSCTQIAGSPQWSGIMSNAPSGGGKWRVADSLAAVEVTAVPAAPVSGFCYARMNCSSETSGTFLSVMYDAPSATLQFVNNVGWSDPSAVSIAYDPVAHRCWRIREAAGTTYWETSSDGVAWTVRRSAASPAWVSVDDATVLLEAARDNGADDFAEFDSFNLFPRVHGDVAGSMPGVQSSLAGSVVVEAQLAGTLPSPSGSMSATARLRAVLGGLLSTLTGGFVGTIGGDQAEIITVEDTVNRRNTARFIAANPSNIRLIPRVRVKDANGMAWVDETPRPLQTVRLIDQSGSVRPFPGIVPTALPGGSQRKVEFLLLGKYDAQVRIGDYWTDLQGVRWEIEELLPYNGYEVRATVVRFGER